MIITVYSTWTARQSFEVPDDFPLTEDLTELPFEVRSKLTSKNATLSSIQIGKRLSPKPRVVPADTPVRSLDK